MKAAFLVSRTAVFALIPLGALELVIQEKSCGDPLMCWAHGTRSMLGTNFTYSASCCSTDLCNRAAGGLGPFWELLIVPVLSVVMAFLC